MYEHLCDMCSVDLEKEPMPVFTGHMCAHLQKTWRHLDGHLHSHCSESIFSLYNSVFIIYGIILMQILSYEFFVLTLSRVP